MKHDKKPQDTEFLKDVPFFIIFYVLRFLPKTAWRIIKTELQHLSIV